QHRSKGVAVFLFALTAAAALGGGVLGDDIAAQRALAVDAGSERAGGSERQRLTDDGGALDLLVGEVHPAERTLRLSAVRAAEAQRPAFGSGRLDDKVHTGGTTIGHFAADSSRFEPSDGGNTERGSHGVASGWCYGVLWCR